MDKEGDIFTVCAPQPSLVDAYYLHPPVACAIFLIVIFYVMAHAL